jgi:hypothetical protein
VEVVFLAALQAQDVAIEVVREQGRRIDALER